MHGEIRKSSRVNNALSFILIGILGGLIVGSMAFVVQGKAFGFENIEITSIAPAILVGFTSALAISILVIRNRNLLLDRLINEEQTTRELKKEIAERRQAEATLRESHQWHALAIAGTNDGIWERNLLTGQTHRSPRWFEILGLEDGGLDSDIKAFEDLIHPEDRDRIVNAMRVHIETGDHFHEEYRVRHQSGEYIWVSAKGQAAWDDNGKPVRMAGSIHDLTERRRIEQAQRENQNRFRELIEGFPFAIQIMGMDSKRLYINQAFLDLLGFQSTDEVYLQPQIANFVEPQDRERVNNYRLARERGEEVPAFYEYEVRRTDGAVIPVQVYTRSLLWNGAPAYQMTYLDLTERREAERALQANEDKLHQAQKLEAVGQLTGGVAHDFNNLLAATMNNAQLLDLKLEGRDDLQVLARSIVAASRSGAELTHRLLAFSRNQTLQPKSVQLGALCEGMSDLLKRSLGAAFDIVLTADDDIWDVLADPSQVESALLNLAINASHAMPNGGKLAINVKNALITSREWAERWEGLPGDYVALIVADTGTGMSADVLDRVFEPFFTTKEVGQGSGLGLSMVYGFAQQSGGFSTIDSIEGKGTTVTIYLPRADLGQEVAKRQAPDAEIPQGRGETILLIEDDAAVRTSATELLGMLGYMVMTAEDGASALEFLPNAETIDLLLSDMTLPGGMNGIDIYKAFHLQWPELKCLFMSGYASLPDGTLPEGAEFLSKPVAMDELANKMRQIFDA